MNKLESWRIAHSGIMKGVVISLTFLCVLPLIFILYFIVNAGIKVIDWSFLTHLPLPVGEVGGGIANALVGTIFMVALATIIAVPTGIFGGIYLSEFKGKKFTNWVSYCVDTMYGIPSIVIGIVMYFWLVRPLGGFSGFSGSLALAVMMLPIIIRSTEETLLQLPENLREGAMGLGMPFHRMVFKVFLPCSMSGIVSGILLAVARVAGETAPLMFTAFGNPFLETNLSKPMQSLPLLIFNYAMSPYESWQKLAWGAAFVLLAWVLLLNIITKIISLKWKVQL